MAYVFFACERSLECRPRNAIEPRLEIETMKRPIAFSVLIVLLGVADASTSNGDTDTGDDKAHRNQGKADIPVV